MTANQLAHDIYCIDVDYIRPRHACSYLITHQGKAAFIDCGTSHSITRLLDTLNQCNLSVDDVEYVIPTHVHLDHAGGAGALMRALPNATAVIHPKGAQHLIDPTRLIDSAKLVYGEEKFSNLYGEIIAIDAARVLTPEDGQHLHLGQRELLITHTPGHARHHMCIFDSLSKAWFTGDTFGISYPDIDCASGHYLMPTTTPTQFEPEAWQDSLDTLLSTCPEKMCLTHFGQVNNPAALAKKLSTDITNYVKIALAHTKHADPLNAIRDAIVAYTLDDLKNSGYTQSEQHALNLLNDDFELNSQGLVIWLKRQR